MRLEPSSAWIFFTVYQTYYFILEPVAAVRRGSVNLSLLIYFPQLIYLPLFLTSLSTATSFAHRPQGMLYAAGVHVAAWTAQFIGHGKFEKRAPAFFDNIVGGMRAQISIRTN
jgi:2-hydroxy fatty acid dioxygenase